MLGVGVTSLTAGAIAGLVGVAAITTTLAVPASIAAGLTSLGITASGGTIFIGTGSALLTITASTLIVVASVVLSVVLGVGIILGVNALRNKGREVREDVGPLRTQSDAAITEFVNSQSGPAKLQDTVNAIQAIVNNLEAESRRN